MKFRALFFDLGNTLLYARDSWKVLARRSDKALAEYLRQQGIISETAPFLDTFVRALETYYAHRENHLVEHSTFEILRRCLPEGTPDSILHAALAKKYAITQENWHLEDDALSTLRVLRETDYRLALLSNAANDADVRALLEKRALAPYFQFVLTSAACGYRKPHPCLFKRALDAFRILPEEAAMIGDTLEADILGANRLGIFSIWITRRADTRAGIPPDSTPDAVIASLSDLPPLLDSLAASPS